MAKHPAIENDEIQNGNDDADNHYRDRSRYVEYVCKNRRKDNRQR
jgi:hypothetical protein